MTLITTVLCDFGQRATALALLIAATTLAAAPEEVQVYMDEMNQPGQFGLDVHSNYVFTGALTDDYPGQQQSLHRFRVTPEFSYGLTPNFELGLYLPLATLDRQDHVSADGVKFRIKYIAPRPKTQNWYYGVNFEIGRVDHKLDQNPWNAELKGIIGKRSGRWTLALNGNFDFKVDGPAGAPASLDVDTKVAYALTKSLSIGIESFNGAGQFRSLGNFAHNDQAGFVVIDKNLGHWDLNLGVGSGYGSNPDRLTIKLILGIPLDWRPDRVQE